MNGEGPGPTGLQIMFHAPWAGQPDAAPLSILASILGSGGGGMRGGRGGSGGTGRLNKILVQEKQLAVNASASSRAQWYVGAFQFSASPRLD